MLDLTQDLPRPTAARRAPLDRLSTIAAQAVQVSAGPVLDRLVLRGDPAAFGLAIPRKLGTAGNQGERAILCLGPDEWLLLAPPGDPDIAELGMFDAAGGAATEISHRQVALIVAGPRACDLLNAGCPLDLHASAFPAGRCTRTLLGKAEIVLWRQALDRFHVEVGRSFANYAWSFLAEAASSLPS